MIFHVPRSAPKKRQRTMGTYKITTPIIKLKMKNVKIKKCKNKKILRYLFPWKSTIYLHLQIPQPYCDNLISFSKSLSSEKLSNLENHFHLEILIVWKLLWSKYLGTLNSILDLHILDSLCFIYDRNLKWIRKFFNINLDFNSENLF